MQVKSILHCKQRYNTLPIIFENLVEKDEETDKSSDNAQNVANTPTNGVMQTQTKTPSKDDFDKDICACCLGASNITCTTQEGCEAVCCPCYVFGLTNAYLADRKPDSESDAKPNCWSPEVQLASMAYLGVGVVSSLIVSGQPQCYGPAVLCLPPCCHTSTLRRKYGMKNDCCTNCTDVCTSCWCHCCHLHRDRKYAENLYDEKNSSLTKPPFQQSSMNSTTLTLRLPPGLQGKRSNKMNRCPCILS